MRTIDLGELYHGIDNIEMVQLDSSYNRHSRFLQGLIDNTEKMVEDEWKQDEEDEKEAAEDAKLGLNASTEERKLINLDKLEEHNNVQLRSRRPYEKHHQMWLDEVDKAADKLEKQMEEVEQEQQEKEYKSPFKTVDHSELYENINLQTQNRYRTPDFDDRVAAYEEAIESEIKQDDELEAKKEEQRKRVLAQGMTPTRMPSRVNSEDNEIHYPNTSINLSEMYGAMYQDDQSLVQVGFDHENDNDDIVPELTENVVVEKKVVETDSRKTDFAGDKFTEVYDD